MQLRTLEMSGADCAMSSSSLVQSASGLVEEVQIKVGGVEYLLIPNPENFLSFDDGNAPVLLLVYVTEPGQTISKSTLRDFRTTTLDPDDVFQPEFFCNVVFYGSKKDDLHIDPDVLEELAAWNTKTSTYVEGHPAAKVAPGPYIFAKGKTWQPWRVYYDFNAAFMTAFKPSPDSSGR
ncbi:Uu.00g141740.m01.CDS01 [Anthostomella pinea]|uniref:Uu.00g141740.m01.CDS01 n=1 Tax=Anthostomella pinea TaxID=933095 RepID=A0AAI8VR90_9PEZI|nr:Uu.00g141740.m01.CDS01 [Anthostomella pinea]